MQTRPFFPEQRKARILTTATFIMKWAVILGAAQAFAALLIFATFINNYDYLKQGARGDVSRLCAPFLHQAQNRK